MRAWIADVTAIVGTESGYNRGVFRSFLPRRRGEERRGEERRRLDWKQRVAPATQVISGSRVFMEKSIA
jgi:hypothetical protein